MLNLLRGNEVWGKPKLAATMFGDRRKQFRERLGWPVEIDPNGYELDQYEAENPLYVILEDKHGNHAGSMRLLPTSGRTMINEHFLEVLGNQPISDPLIWECTRFCLAPKQSPRTALKLLASGARLMREARLKKLVGVFDATMIRVYQNSGVLPEIVGSHEYPFGEVHAGFWSFDADIYTKLLKLSGLDPVMLELIIANTKVPWREHATADQI